MVRVDLESKVSANCLYDTESKRGLKADICMVGRSVSFRNV